MNDVKPLVRQFIVDNFIMGTQGVDFSDGDSFIERRIVDSTSFLELVTFLESTFQMRIEDEDLVPENLDSLDAIERFVGRKVGSPA